MDWIVLTIIFAFLSLGGISALYMMARAFKLGGLERWCKSEYLEIFITALIILGIIAFIEGMLLLGGFIAESIKTQTLITDPSAILAALSAGLNPTNIAVKEIYNIMAVAKEIYNSVFILNFIVAFVKEFVLVGIELNPLGPLAGPVMGIFEWTINTLGFFTIYMYFFAEIIKYGDYLAVLLLPSGIVLRAFPITRGAGAMFIAIALGLALVLPVSYLMVAYVAGSTSQNLEPYVFEGTEEYNQMLENICINDFGSMVMVKEMAMSIDYSSVIKTFTEGGFFALMMRMFISPLIALIITYTFIRSFATMLGADLAEIGRGLIKMI